MSNVTITFSYIHSLTQSFGALPNYLLTYLLTYLYHHGTLIHTSRRIIAETLLVTMTSSIEYVALIKACQTPPRGA